jgi:hypothetical protein
MTDTLEGGCACGAVRYRLLSAPMFVHCCHCRDCQRQTGTAFALNALIETDRVEIVSGSPKIVPVPTDSGRPHEIHRCPACDTAVWSTYGGRTVWRFVRVGTLEDPTALRAHLHSLEAALGHAARRHPGIRGLLRCPHRLAGGQPGPPSSYFRLTAPDMVRAGVGA